MINDIINHLKKIKNIKNVTDLELNELTDILYQQASILSNKETISQEVAFDKILQLLYKDENIKNNSDYKKVCSNAKRTPNEYDDENVMISDPDLNRWNFYIRFKISKPLDINETEIRIFNDYLLVSGSKKNLKESNILKLIGLKPMLYREIILVSKKIEQALILAFTDLSIGIVYANDIESEALTEKIRKSVENDFRNNHLEYSDFTYTGYLSHPNDGYGLTLFQYESTPIQYNAEMEFTPLTCEELEVSFSNYFNKLGEFNYYEESFKKINTASNILATSLFDDSLINKIILSMTAIEVLSEKLEKSQEEIKVINTLIENLNNMKINNEIKSSLEKGLMSLKNQSIGKSCRILVKKLLGKEKSKKFYDIYDFRSQLVHTGKLKDNDKDKLIRIKNDAYMIAKDTLDAYLKEITTQTCCD